MNPRSQCCSVLLDIDTQGKNPYGGLPVLNELRKLNESLILISLSRSRTRAVEKQAVADGAGRVTED